jgi:hypothetical protein
MSMRQLESAITSEARRIFNNPKLRVKDLMEWSTGQIKPQDGEVVERMPLNGVYVAIKAECDKRSNDAVCLMEAEKPESTEPQLEPAWPPATPPLHGRGWPQGVELPPSAHETGCEIENSQPSRCNKPSTGSAE